MEFANGMMGREMRELMSLVGYHVPAVRRRDKYYASIEDQRSKALGQV
jgi:hypothetical protein